MINGSIRVGKSFGGQIKGIFQTDMLKRRLVWRFLFEVFNPRYGCLKKFGNE
jgi:hypothetical protein